MAVICVTYLGFHVLDKDVADDDAIEAIYHGDLQLLDYVRSSWVKHVLTAYDGITEVTSLGVLPGLIRANLVEKHFTSNGGQTQQTPILSKSETAGLPITLMSSELRAGLNRVLAYRKTLQENNDKGQGRSSFFLG